MPSSTAISTATAASTAKGDIGTNPNSLILNNCSPATCSLYVESFYVCNQEN